MADEAAVPLATRRVFLGLLIWLLAALLLGASGMPRRIPPPGPQLMILVLAFALTASGLMLPRFRAWFFTVDARVILSFHLTRFVGFYLIVLFLEDELPYDFAVLGGIGDIVVATIAMTLITTSRLKSRAQAGSYFLWNLIGFVDILYVVITAARLSLEDPYALRPLQRLPLFLLPSFVVPIIIGTHILFGIRLSRMFAKASAVRV